MQDDDLRKLFEDFQPELSSDSLFLNKLQQHLDAVELIKRHNAALKKYSRTAVAIAACVGFVVGMVFTLALPYLGHFISGVSVSPHENLIAQILCNNYRLIAWGCIAAVSCSTAFNSYELYLSFFRPKYSI